MAAAVELRPADDVLSLSAKRRMVLSVVKTAAHTDTYHGQFARLVPDERVVEVLEFETADPDLAGEMTMTTTLTDVDGGTEILVEHEGMPRGVSAADDELGTRMALSLRCAGRGRR